MADSQHDALTSSSRETPAETRRSASCAPVAIQLPDRLRWWRQHRLREQPIPEGHYILNRDFFNYTTFGSRPLSQHLLKDLRNARLALAHHYSAAASLAVAEVGAETTAAAVRPTASASPSGDEVAAPLPAPRHDDDDDDDDDAPEGLLVHDEFEVDDNKRDGAHQDPPPPPQTSRATHASTDGASAHHDGNDDDGASDATSVTGHRGRASRPPVRHLSPNECVSLERFIQLFRTRAASAPVRPSYHRDTGARRSSLARHVSGSNPVPHPSRGAGSVVHVPEETAASSRVLVLHNPPRIVLQTKHMPSDAMLHAANVSRADREQTPRLLDRPEVIDLSLFPLLPFERDFYKAQLNGAMQCSPASGHANSNNNTNNEDDGGAPLPASGLPQTQTDATPFPESPASGGADWEVSSVGSSSGYSASPQAPVFSPTLLPSVTAHVHARHGHAHRRHRRRAASQPALPLLWSTDLLSAHTNASSGTNGRPSSPGTLHRRRTRPDSAWAETAAPAESGTHASAESSSHLCRRLADLQDAYVFNPLVDGVGQGAFSQVYAAVPLAPRVLPTTAMTTTGPTQAEGVPVVALKIIARKGKQRDEQRQRMRPAGFGAHPPAARGGGGGGYGADDDASAEDAGALDRKPRDDASLRDCSQRRELVEVEREISVLRQLKHTGCSLYYEALRTPDAFVIAMKLNKGSMDTRQFLSRFGPPSEARSALIVYQLVETIHYLHNVFGVLHRDIKLENVLVSLIETVPIERVNEVIGPQVSKDDPLTHHHRYPSTEHKAYVKTRDPESSSSTTTTAAGAPAAVAGPVSPTTTNNVVSGASPTSVLPVGSPTTPAVARLPPNAFEIQGARSLGLSTIDTAALLLRATLIDFGLARRIHAAAAPPHRQSSSTTGSYAVGGGNSLSSPPMAGGGAGAGGGGMPRRGMPTPLPSTANMFTGYWEVEEESGASSTDVSASQTEEDEDEAEAVQLAMANTSHTDEAAHDGRQSFAAAMPGRSASVSTQPPMACATPPAARLPPRCPSSAANLSSNKLMMAASPSQAQLNAAGPRRLYSTTHTSVNTRSESGTRGSVPSVPRSTSLPHLSPADMPEPAGQSISDSGANALVALVAPVSNGTSVRSSAATTPMIGGGYAGLGAAHRSASVGPCPAPQTATTPRSPGGGPSANNYVADDSATILLTPCGTEKYLAPEMLDWIVHHGWARRPTAVGMAKQLDMYAVGVMTYVLLSGSFPFNGTTRATLAQQQKRVPRCSSDRWRGVSSSAISFVQGLLEPDPERRLTAEAALKHPFLREAAYWAGKLHLVPGPITPTGAPGRPEYNSAAGAGGGAAAAGGFATPRSEALSAEATRPCAPTGLAGTAGGMGGTATTQRKLDSSMDVDALVDQLLRDSCEASPTRGGTGWSPSKTSSSAVTAGGVEAVGLPVLLPTPSHDFIEPTAAGGAAAVRTPATSADRPPAHSDDDDAPVAVAVQASPSPASVVAAATPPPPSVALARVAVVSEAHRGQAPAPAAAPSAKGGHEGDDDDLFDALYNNIMSSD